VSELLNKYVYYTVSLTLRAILLGLLRPLIFCNRLTVPKKTGQPVNR